MATHCSVLAWRIPGTGEAITDLEPDILECDVKLALESLTRNKWELLATFPSAGAMPVGERLWVSQAHPLKHYIYVWSPEQRGTREKAGVGSCQEKSHGQRSLAGYGPWGRKESLSQEDPLKEEMATHSRILAWEIP